MGNDPLIEHQPYSVDEAFAFCARVTNSHYENFPVASLFLPEAQRPYIQAIYAFSRTADDFADEPGYSPEERLQALEQWDEQLRDCYKGKASHPVFIALRETVTNLDIPIEPLLNLLTAFKRDVSQNRYETFDDLLSYCACSANPVGRLILMMFGYRDEAFYALSDNICTALQLTNFWQDVAVDQTKDRLYLPLEDMKRFGYTTEQWNARIVNQPFKDLMKFQVERTRELFYQGASLPTSVERDLQLELKLVWFGGMSILRKIERVKYDVVGRRPSLSTLSKGLILARALLINRLDRFGRKKDDWDLQ
ncbi:MAG TPA: squalene synthase HpnC [Bacteroidota bacterium]|nr:squalene synthase HpnC [Bacteroidota bacterium]